MDNFILRLLPLVVFGFLFYRALKKKNKLASTIIGLYFLTSICSLLMSEKLLRYHDFETDSFGSFLIYTAIHGSFLSLTFLVKPFKRLRELPDGGVYNYMVMFFLFGAIYSTLYLTPYAINSLAGSALELRTEMQTEELKVLPSTIFTTIAVGFPYFYYVYIFIFFNALLKGETKVAFLSLLGPLAYIMNVFTVAGRDGVLFITFGFLLIYFQFENLIKRDLKKIFKRYFLVGVFLFSIPIISISNERFSKTGKFDMTTFNKGIIFYLGTQPFVFSDYLKDPDPVFNYGVNIFPLFTNKERVEARKEYSGIFASSLSSFYMISGYASVFGMGLIFYATFKQILGRTYTFSGISLIFCYGLFFHFMISGVFYFRMGNKGGNLFLILSLLIAIFLRKRKLGRLG
ncbi:oligosaccharide repeat unit polymerase [Akkermansiaceae bacterium]|nr:oligosaccharide repeat unit polymerase [Akkermansiaceae bacterium]